MFKNFYNDLYQLSFNFGKKLIIAVVILIIGLLLIKFANGAFKKTLKKTKIDLSIKTFLSSAASAILKIALFITVLSVAGIPMTSFVALIGAAGVAIALSMQNLLSNLIGGLTILFFKPFKISECIETNEHLGIVKEIGIMYSKLNTFDNKTIIIPNGEISNARIINYSAEKIRRVDLEYSVSFNSNFIQVKKVLLEIVENHPKVIKEPAPFIGIMSYDKSIINIVVRPWCNNEDWFDVMMDVNEKVKAEFDKNGIVMPSTEITIKNKE